MRILISGSHGFIGNALCEKLSKAGHEIIRVVHRNPVAGEILIDYKNSVLRRTSDTDQGLREDEGLLPESVFDVVINLAGEPITASRWDSAQRAKLYDSRIATTKILGDALAELDQKPKVFISGSAVGYYGSRKDEILTETSKKGTGFLSDLCEKWEETALSFQTPETRVALLRTGIVLKKEGGLLKSVLPMFKNGVAGKLGSGQQWMSWISMADMLEAVEFIMSNDAIIGPVNITAPEPVQNVDMTHILAGLCKKPAHLNMPQLALELAFGKVTTAEFVLASQRTLPNVLTEAGFDFTYPNIEDALQYALG